MSRRVTLLRRAALALAGLLLVGAALLAGLTYWVTPRVVVHNQASAPVQVTAEWAAGRKALAAMAPGERRSFRVEGESAIEFVVTYSDGRTSTSSPMYFTTATTVTAVVSDQGVAASADLCFFCRGASAPDR